MTSLFSKIGKYGRPIFWAGSMSYLSYIFYKIIGDFFIPGGQEFLVSVYNDVGDILVGVFTTLVLIILLAVSVYKVTHPYISKNGYDESDEQWAVGICIFASIIILHILLIYLFDFDLLD
jgi:uncharacterized membrane protein YhaH (DUF805 family)